MRRKHLSVITENESRKAAQQAIES